MTAERDAPRPARLRRSQGLPRRRPSGRVPLLRPLGPPARRGGDRPPRRRQPSPALIDAARAALASRPARRRTKARRFFEARFRPFRIVPGAAGFLTGYYEPLRRRLARRNRRVPMADPGAPRRPRRLRAGRGAARAFRKASRGRGEAPTARSSPTTTGRRSNGTAPTRSSGSGTRSRPFSSRCRARPRSSFPDGRRARLAYDGRNGLPYTSIGRILIETGEIAESAHVARAPEGLAARGGRSARARPG